MSLCRVVRIKVFVDLLLVWTVTPQLKSIFPFVTSNLRTPVEILQFKGLLDAGSGYRLQDSFEIEYEVILIWVTFIPTFLNPIIYFSFLTDYRYA